MRTRATSTILILATLLAAALGAGWWATRPPGPSPIPQVRGRILHTATLLADGTVLVVGGSSFAEGGALDVAERYDPATGLWRAAGRLRAGRYAHTATRLADNTVLVVGGVGGGGFPWSSRDTVASVERYDPATNRWSAAAALPEAVADHAALALPGGDVLVVGGRGRLSLPSESERAWRYDPARDSWSPAPPLPAPRSRALALLAPGGDAIVLGGGGTYGASQGSTGVRLAPGAGEWTPVSALPFAVGPGPAGALLADGRILLVGESASAVYDPVGDRWGTPVPYAGRSADGTVSALPGGGALLVAGTTIGRYDAATDAWSLSRTAPPRYRHAATTLPDGRVLIVGGADPRMVSPDDVLLIEGRIRGDDTVSPRTGRGR